MTASTENTGGELDLRGLPKPLRHPHVYRTIAELPVGGSVVLVNDHDPIHLRQQLDRDLTGSVGWELQSSSSGEWRIRLTRLASTPLPRTLLDTRETRIADADVAGAVWRLEPSERDLDANLISLPPGGTIAEHVGADLDVLWHVVDGDGTLRTELAEVPLQPGAVVYLPRRARRAVLAGPDGLRYLSVHQRKQTLPLTPSVIGHAP